MSYWRDAVDTIGGHQLIIHNMQGMQDFYEFVSWHHAVKKWGGQFGINAEILLQCGFLDYASQHDESRASLKIVHVDWRPVLVFGVSKSFFY